MRTFLGKDFFYCVCVCVCVCVFVCFFFLGGGGAGLSAQNVSAPLRKHKVPTRFRTRNVRAGT